MKKSITLAILMIISLTSFAQIDGSGYYRVRNNATHRYIYLYDGTSSGINIQASTADMGAVQLWKDRDLLDDPATVLYAKNIDGDYWDLQAQGTGVYDLIGYNVKVITKSKEQNLYQVSASLAGATVYLFDGETTDVPDGTLRTSQDDGSIPPANNRWNVYKINQDDNYIGVTPNVTVGDKNYKPYYVSFPFSFYSTGMKAYYVKKVDYEKNVAVIAEATGIIPSSAPVIIECSSTDKANNKLQLQDYESYKTPINGNVLSGVYFSTKYRKSSMSQPVYDANTMRVLGKTASGKLGFITATTDMLNNCRLGKGDPIWCLRANESYLTVNEGSAAEFEVVTEEEYAKLETKVSAITLNTTEVSLYSGETTTLTATVTPENATNKELSWESSDENVASVDQNGVVTANSVGEAIITVSAKDGSNTIASCKITVMPILISSISISKKEVSLTNGEQIQLTATVQPENAENKTFSWKSSNTNVATVDQTGLVSMVNAGSAVITVSTTDGSNLSDKCNVTCILDGIAEVIGNNGKETYYTLDGKNVSNMKNGVYVVRGANGKSVKVVK